MFTSEYRTESKEYLGTLVWSPVYVGEESLNTQVLRVSGRFDGVRGSTRLLYF